MKRSTSLLLTGALSVGTVAVLSVAAPGVASAGTCGTTTLTEKTFPTTFSTAETRSKGHNVVVDGGLHVYTDDASSEAKAAALFATQLNLPLAGQTAESNYDLDQTLIAGGKPGYNLVVDINGPATGGYTTLVKEEGQYGDKWWTNSSTVQGVPAGGGYAHLGSIQEYSDANPEAVILTFGYSLGSGVKGDVTITKIRFGCNDFVFDLENRAPVAVAKIDDNSDSDYRTYFLSGTTSTDPDGDPLTYSWTVDGAVVSTAGEFTHTFPKGRKDYQVVLTVSDGKLTNSTSQTVSVTPPADTVSASPLPNTGANVLGMAAVGAVVLAGSGAGMVATRRRRAGNHAA